MNDYVNANGSLKIRNLLLATGSLRQL